MTLKTFCPAMGIIEGGKQVCSGVIEIPIVLAVTAKRTEKEYINILSHIKEQIENYEGETVLKKVVLDSEKASIGAASLSKGWDRRRDELALVEYTPRLRKRFRVLSAHSFPPGHAAYERCHEFLRAEKSDRWEEEYVVPLRDKVPHAEAPKFP
ncbi:hypothetical protein OESDEN_11268 [Oesophagostomum dentatum]|uniref:MULE transposase domain-containing protein n=1 Tax=Oesophagostomum dentatum TaxID=61180 RepID=A0A0B1SZI3_OESDE|nr:hypothetical protein OESDEN_11268 [Oesophagostomum dentatum]